MRRTGEEGGATGGRGWRGGDRESRGVSGGGGLEVEKGLTCGAARLVREGEEEEVMWQKNTVACGTRMCHISKNYQQNRFDVVKGGNLAGIESLGM